MFTWNSLEDSVSGINLTEVWGTVVTSEEAQCNNGYYMQTALWYTALKTATDYSVCMWHKMDSAQVITAWASWKLLIAQSNWSSSQKSFGYKSSINTGRNIALRRSVSLWYDTNWTANPVDNERTHFCVTWDYSTQECSTYVNWVAGTIESCPLTVANGGGYMCAWRTGIYPPVAFIDNVYIYNSIITPAEVSVLYAEMPTNGTPPTPTVPEWIEIFTGIQFIAYNELNLTEVSQSAIDFFWLNFFGWFYISWSNFFEYIWTDDASYEYKSVVNNLTWVYEIYIDPAVQSDPDIPYWLYIKDIATSEYFNMDQMVYSGDWQYAQLTWEWILSVSLSMTTTGNDLVWVIGTGKDIGTLNTIWKDKGFLQIDPYLNYNWNASYTFQFTSWFISTWESPGNVLSWNVYSWDTIDFTLPYYLCDFWWIIYFSADCQTQESMLLLQTIDYAITSTLNSCPILLNIYISSWWFATWKIWLELTNRECTPKMLTLLKSWNNYIGTWSTTEIIDCDTNLDWDVGWYEMIICSKGKQEEIQGNLEKATNLWQDFKQKKAPTTNTTVWYLWLWQQANFTEWQWTVLNYMWYILLLFFLIGFIWLFMI